MYDTRCAQLAATAEKKEEAVLETQPRVQIPKLAEAQRRTNFNEIEIGLSAEAAMQEAKRCLRCDLEAGE